MELKEQTWRTDTFQHLLRQSADRQEREGDFLRGRLREVHNANDKLMATAFRMASRIVISGVQDINEADLDEHLCRRYDALRELNFNVGDTEEIIQAAREGETHEMEMALAVIMR